MKKSILLLMLFIGTAMVFTSCKKDDKPSEKERITELLISGKWYYNSKTVGETTHTCFWEAQYWEFKADGTYTETGDELESGTYTVNQDGKSLTLTSKNVEKAGKTTSFTINTTTLSMTVDFGFTPLRVTLSKTAGGCAP